MRGCCWVERCQWVLSSFIAACPTACCYPSVCHQPSHLRLPRLSPSHQPCAGNAPGYPNNICKGDSGGPLLILGTGSGGGGSSVPDVQLGISSFTHNANICLGEPAGFTNLAQLGPWIAATVDELVTGRWVGRGEWGLLLCCAVPPCAMGRRDDRLTAWPTRQQMHL